LIVEALNELASEDPAIQRNSITVDEILSRSSTYDDIVDQLCRIYKEAAERNRESGLSSEGIVDAAIEFLQCSLYRNISVRELAEKLGFSISYVHRVLHSALGKSPMEYFNSLKIEEAKHLMKRYPNMKVKEIAKSLGFQDQHYFSKVFKAHASLSPMEYRRRLQRGIHH
jgi:two-component system response regulator YesN